MNGNRGGDALKGSMDESMNGNRGGDALKGSISIVASERTVVEVWIGIVIATSICILSQETRIMRFR
jgi:ribosomal protein L19